MKVVAVKEPAFMPLLNVAETFALGETPTAPAVGIVVTTVGGTSLVPVVNDHTYGSAKDWLARFFTPVPIVTVITVF